MSAAEGSLNSMESEDLEFANKEEALKYVDALCANIADKKVRKATRKELLFNLRNKYGAIV